MVRLPGHPAPARPGGAEAVRTFGELCRWAKVTPDEREALMYHLAMLRTIKLIRALRADR